jgi:beta-galactosidase/beta-glucuronidase
MAKNVAQAKAADEAPALFHVDRLEYPRPQLVRPEHAKLNGQWSFAFDQGDRGLAEQWFAPGKAFDRQITVPFPYQCEKSGVNEKDIHNVVWYKRRFTLPKEWDLKGTDRDLLLHFGAVDYLSTIYVNGVEAWTNAGGHVPFHINIEPYLAEGENEICVRVEDSQDAHQPRGKQAVDGKSANIFYYNTTGIWQDVWMEPVPKVRVERLRMTPSARQRAVDFEVPVTLAQHVACCGHRSRGL